MVDMVEKRKDSLPFYSESEEKGSRILMETSLQTKDLELQKRAKELLRLFLNLDKLRATERELGIKPKKSARGFAMGSKNQILEVIGRNGRVLRRGQGTVIMPDFWEHIKRIRELSLRHRSGLRQMQQKRKRPKPTSGVVKKRVRKK